MCFTFKSLALSPSINQGDRSTLTLETWLSLTVLVLFLPIPSSDWNILGGVGDDGGDAEDVSRDDADDDILGIALEGFKIVSSWLLLGVGI